jgi:hypothetical protein
MVMTPTDNVDSVPDYRIPVGDYINPGRSVPMPVPRNFPTESPIPDGSGSADTGSTQDSGRRSPSSHPALR